jgi:hypothetical protein
VISRDSPVSAALRNPKKPGFYHFSDKLLEKSGFLALIMGVFVEEKA